MRVVVQQPTALAIVDDGIRVPAEVVGEDFTESTEDIGPLHLLAVVVGFTAVLPFGWIFALSKP